MAVVGLAGCEEIPPVLTVDQPVLVVGTQLGPSERIEDPYGDFVSETSVPMLLRWSATDNNTVCAPRFSGREMWDAHGDDRLFSNATTTEVRVVGRDYPEEGPAGRHYGWGITAHDCSQNDSPERVVGRRVVIVQENGLVASGVWHSPFTVSATPTGSWMATEHEELSGGEALTTVDPDAAVSFTYDFGPRAGRPVAVVTSDGPDAGARADVLVDGRRVATTGPRLGGPRTIVWSGAMPPGEHTVTVRKAADGGSAPLTVDAFVVADGVWPECGRLVCDE